MKRRNFVKMVGLGGIAATTTSLRGVEIQGGTSMIKIDPKPLFELSPWLYMQFMEPLGVTDSSVEASWDHQLDQWKPDLIEATCDLAPGMIRWGGLLSAYYRWKEGVGPREKRIPMYNICWGGYETNQIGTAEFIDFCRQVGADPLMTINFESEGDPRFLKTVKGDDRCGNAKEAAEWVDYCNNPSNKLRRGHGFADPLRVDIWQIGNETSYSNRRFNSDTAVRKTIEFADAMKKVDPTIKLIAWGEGGFAEKMLKEAGDKINYIAFHDMFNAGQPIRDNEYRKDPVATWETLMDSYKIHERKIKTMREIVEPYKFPLALTECHFSLPGRNRCEVLSSWAVGVAYARMMNLHMRHGDLLKIATMADFCGTRWQVNAIMIPVPSGRPFLMPVAKIMRLYRRHSGKDFIQTETPSGSLDVTASRTDNKIYVHVVNTSLVRSMPIRFYIEGMTVVSGMAYELCTDPEFEIISAERDPLIPKEKEIDVNSSYLIPPASVSAFELTCA